MNIIRKSMVAGSFYNSDALTLKNQIDFFGRNTAIKKKYSDILGIISPHAGYIYSGQCAAYSYNTLSQKDFDTAVIIAPSHRVSGFKISIGNYDYYETPFGNIPVNQHYRDLLLSFIDCNFYPDAHKYEHSLEVQLPFLQTINPKVNIVPIILGEQNIENSIILSQILFKIFADKIDNTAFIVSSDLSHYYDAKTALKKDSLLLDLIKKGMPDLLWNKYISAEIEACGIGGILTLMEFANLTKYKNREILNYSHSGKINNDYSQVVGYGSLIFYK